MWVQAWGELLPGMYKAPSCCPDLAKCRSFLGIFFSEGPHPIPEDTTWPNLPFPPTSGPPPHAITLDLMVPTQELGGRGHSERGVHVWAVWVHHACGA